MKKKKKKKKKKKTYATGGHEVTAASAGARGIRVGVAIFWVCDFRNLHKKKKHEINEIKCEQ